jgi:hypothetical protein
MHSAEPSFIVAGSLCVVKPTNNASWIAKMVSKREIGIRAARVALIVCTGTAAVWAGVRRKSMSLNEIGFGWTDPAARRLT